MLMRIKLLVLDIDGVLTDGRIIIGALGNEYRGTILLLVSDASSYMTRANLIINGGKTCW